MHFFSSLTHNRAAKCQSGWFMHPSKTRCLESNSIKVVKGGSRELGGSIAAVETEQAVVAVAGWRSRLVRTEDGGITGHWQRPVASSYPRPLRHQAAGRLDSRETKPGGEHWAVGSKNRVIRRTDREKDPRWGKQCNVYKTKKKRIKR